MKAKVYRSGTVETPATRGVEADSYTAADAVKPAGRQGRTDGIFAAPTLAGVARWTYANTSIARCVDPFVREITVDPDKVYVYSVLAWEKASWGTAEYEAYWETGMTLTQWMAASEFLDATNWELLLGADDVISTRPVSDKRLLENSKSFNLHSELVRTITSARKALRWA